MTETGLIVVENINPVKLFTDGGLDEILKGIRAKLDEFVPDVSTDEGRKEIASMAHKVSRSKTLLDDFRKGVIAEAKAKVDKANGLWKPARETLDRWRDETRLPLTEWEAEEAKRQEEADRIEKEKIQERINALQVYGAVLPFQEVAVMTDEEFETTLAGSKEAFEAEKKRLADEEADRKAEEERLEKQRKDQEAAQEKIDAANKKIAAEKAVLEAARTKIFQTRQAELKSYDVAMSLDEISKLSDDQCAGLIASYRLAYQKEQDRLADEAAEQAKADAKAAIEKEERDRLAKIEADKAEAERQEALKPDKEKLIDFADMILSISAPDLKATEAKEVYRVAREIINDNATWIKEEVEDI